MYRKIPKTKKTAATLFVIVLLGVGVFSLFMGGVKILPLPMLAQIIGIGCMVVAVFILSQRVLKDFTYEIARTERNVSQSEVGLGGEAAYYDFLIYERKGWRDITVCRVGLDEITEASEITPKNRSEYKKLDRTKKRYTYDAQFAPWHRLRVIINEDTAVYLTYDEELWEILRGRNTR